MPLLVPQAAGGTPAGTATQPKGESDPPPNSGASQVPEPSGELPPAVDKEESTTSAAAADPGDPGKPHEVNEDTKGQEEKVKGKSAAKKEKAEKASKKRRRKRSKSRAKDKSDQEDDSREPDTPIVTEKSPPAKRIRERSRRRGSSKGELASH